MNQPPKKRQHFDGICASTRKSYYLFLIRAYCAVSGKGQMGQTGLVESLMDHMKDQEEFSLLSPSYLFECLGLSP